jgi:hypothetical protein
MIVTKKRLSRRTVLRGLGASLSLPLLDGMIPALTPLRLTAAQPVRRLGVVYLPNGMNMARWTPSEEGAGFALPPTLGPLAPYRKDMLVLSGMSNREADTQPGEGLGDHSRGQAAFLTGVHCKNSQGADIEAGISMDQIAAKTLGEQTQLASLELALEANDLMGGCESGLSCAYVSTVAWRSAKTPLPMEPDPRAVFERLFGASTSTDAGARLARIRMDRSILDAVTDDLAHLQNGLGSTDRAKLTEYLEAVRDIERRIQKAEQQSGQDVEAVERPGGVPHSFQEYAKVMFDLMALAYQTDMTRVATFLYGREQSNRTYPEIGVPDPHHPVSHHQDRPDQLEKLAKINLFHMTLFAHFVERLRSTPDGDGSLLDHSLILYGAGLSNSNIHLHHDLPILLLGGASGGIAGGRHVRLPKDTPLANLHLTLLDRVGVPVDRLGDSTGRLDLISGV